MNRISSKNNKNDKELIAGKRIRLINTSDSYTTLKPGDTGMIICVAVLPKSIGGGKRQIWVKWDKDDSASLKHKLHHHTINHQLPLIEDIDEFEIIQG